MRSYSTYSYLPLWNLQLHLIREIDRSDHPEIIGVIIYLVRGQPRSIKEKVEIMIKKGGS